jgi:hypothetical protein
MNRKPLLISSLSLILLITAQANGQYIFRNFNKAYEKGTRSMDGRPGPHYWQNYAKYKINASADPATGKISGKMTAEYINNSPDTLKRIVMRLYPDLFRRGNVRLLPASPEDIGDGMNLSSLTINGEKIEITDPARVTRADANMDVKIKNHVAPGASGLCFGPSPPAPPRLEDAARPWRAVSYFAPGAARMPAPLWHKE